MTKRKQYKRIVEIERDTTYWQTLAFIWIMSAWIFGLVVGRFAAWYNMIPSLGLPLLMIVWAAAEIRHEREIKIYFEEIKVKKK